MEGKKLSPFPMETQRVHAGNIQREWPDPNPLITDELTGAGPLPCVVASRKRGRMEYAQRPRVH